MSCQFLFHQEDYIQAVISPEDEEHWYTVTCQNGRGDDNVPLAGIHLFGGGPHLTSHYKASFGGPFLQGDTDDYLIGKMLELATEAALQNGASTIRHVLPPLAYSPDIQGITSLLMAWNSSILYQDVNCHIPVSSTPFEELIDSDERRYLRLAQRQGLAFEWLPLEQAPAVYDLIAANRQLKGFELGQTLPQFLAMLQNYPQAYRLCALKNAHDFAAVAVLVSLSPQVLYTFYTAQSAAWARYSPLVALHQHLYEFAAAQGYALLDLGTVSKEGVMNEGNARFKRKLGARTSARLTLIQQVPG